MANLGDLDPNQINQLIGLLQQMLPKSEDEPKKSKSKPKAKEQKLKSVTKSKRIVDQDRQNKFLSMPEMGMHKSDTSIDKKLQKFPPTPRSREFSLIDVKCRICGKTDEVSPKLLPESADRYKCNNCSSTQG
jgi:hypothetical protein